MAELMWHKGKFAPMGVRPMFVKVPDDDMDEEMLGKMEEEINEYCKDPDHGGQKILSTSIRGGVTNDTFKELIEKQLIGDIVRANRYRNAD
mmetsp:Transcript_34472/g.87099  ORF Transcript_34472/g.87099 Transcript_34472/m.87099 type:complete len:91 (-) Transcript_34472:140-412(-)